MKIGSRLGEGRQGEYSFERCGFDKSFVTITGPDVGDFHPHREMICMPVETLVKYLVKTGQVVKKKATEKRKR